MFPVADCELLGRQVGNGTATDDVEDTEVYVDVVSVMPKGKNRYYNLKVMLVLMFLEDNS